MNKSTRDSSMLGKLWVMVMRVVGIGSGVLAGMVAARYLSEADFGILSVLLNQVALWSIVAGLGLNRLLVRMIAEKLAVSDVAGAQQILSRGELLLLAMLVIVFAGVSTALTAAGASMVGSPLNLSQALLTAGLAAAYGWHQVTGELLRGLRWINWAGAFGAPPGGVGPAVGAMSLVAVIITALSGSLTLESFLLIHLTIALTLCLPAAWSLYRAYSTIPQETANPELVSPTSHTLAKMLPVALPLMFMQVLIFLGSQADIWIAGREFASDPRSIALFAAAKRVSFFITLPLQFAQLTVVASIAHLYANGEIQKLQRVLQRSALYAFIPATIIAAVAFFAPRWILSLMYGPAYKGADLYLQTLVVGTWIYMATGMCSLTLIMTGHERVAFPVTILSAVMLIVGGTFAAQHSGVLGLAVASTFVLGFTNVAQWWLARRYVGVWVHPGWGK